MSSIFDDLGKFNFYFNHPQTPLVSISLYTFTSNKLIQVTLYSRFMRCFIHLNLPKSATLMPKQFKSLLSDWERGIVLALIPEPAVNPPADSVAAERAPGKDDSGGGPAIDEPDKGAGGGTEFSCGLFRATAIPIGTELSKTTTKPLIKTTNLFLSNKKQQQ